MEKNWGDTPSATLIRLANSWTEIMKESYTYSPNKCTS